MTALAEAWWQKLELTWKKEKIQQQMSIQEEELSRIAADLPITVQAWSLEPGLPSRGGLAGRALDLGLVLLLCYQYMSILNCFNAKLWSNVPGHGDKASPCLLHHLLDLVLQKGVNGPVQ